MIAGATLALDLGTHLGWALQHSDGRVESGVEDFSPDKHEQDGLRFLRFRAWLHDVKVRLEAGGEELALIRYERINFAMPGQVYASHVYGANWGTLTAWAEHHKIEYEGIYPTTIKKYVTGSGRASKDQVKRAVRALGFNPATHDEADALALLALTMEWRIAA